MPRTVFAFLAIVCALSVGCGRVTAEPAMIIVGITLTDADYRPLPHVAGRLGFASDRDGQRSGGGVSFETGGDGKATLRVAATVDHGRRTLPSLGGLTRILARPVAFDHVRVGVELAHAGEALLYVIDASSFDDGGTVSLDDVRVYAQGADGVYDREVQRQYENGTVTAAYAYTVTDYALAPTAAPGTWALDLAFKRLPEPVRIDR